MAKLEENHWRDQKRKKSKRRPAPKTEKEWRKLREDLKKKLDRMSGEQEEE